MEKGSRFKRTSYTGLDWICDVCGNATTTEIIDGAEVAGERLIGQLCLALCDDCFNKLKSVVNEERKVKTND